jgi:K+-sensing histidine kinase KdpD
LKNKPAVLVCVTGQHDCDRLIRTGKNISDELSLTLSVLCVLPASAGYQTDCNVLEYLRQTARDAGAEMTIYFHNDAPFTAVSFAKKLGTAHIVTGMAGTAEGGFIDIIHRLMPHTPISMVAKDGTVYHICPASKDERNAKLLAART